MEVLFYILIFMGFVIIEGFATDSNSYSSAQSYSSTSSSSSSHSEAHSSAYAESYSSSSQDEEDECGLNEIFDECPSQCPYSCDVDERLVKCKRYPEPGSADCEPGCRCIDNYKRNKTGDCIPKEDCPPFTNVKCGPDEVYSSCVNGGCGRWNCSQPGIICYKLAQGACREGCHCKDKLLRADNGTCIPADQCPSKNCGKNEIFDECPATCPEQSCDVDEAATLCLPSPKPGDPKCQPRCRCIDNYKKNKDGVCIPKEESPKPPPLSCPPGEEYNSCINGGCGRWNCSQEAPMCIDLVQGACVEGCRCIAPLLRSNDGSCVSADQCPPICIGENESAACDTFCSDTCESIDQSCEDNATENCKLACRCNTGFYRDDDGDCVTEDQCPTSKTGIEKFNQGNVIFTENFLKVKSKENSKESAIYSPFSLLFLLAQLALYATGNSRQQLLSVLNLKSNNLIRATIPNYLNDINSQNNVTLDLAARTYANINYKLNKSFVKDSKDVFGAESQNLDFSQSAEAAKIINNWVEMKTHKIKSIVSPDSLNSNTRLVLVNAIYFKGDWRSPFKKRNTKEKSFYVNSNKNVTVKMMNQVGSFNYAEISEPRVQVLELPYVNRNLTFLICLPKSKDGIDNLINSLGNASLSVLTNAIKSLKYTRMDVSIPTMDVTTTTDLTRLLPELNVGDIFKAKTAGLQQILENHENISVTSATQKAIIIVNESGTEAAAANSMVVGVTSVRFKPEPVVFNANHPYAYFILFKGTPIFCGVYRGPKK